MPNLIQWITEAAQGESIESVVIGEMGWGNYGSEQVPNYSEQLRGIPLRWEEAKIWLDYEFDSGYGAPRCNAIYAWTKSWVIFVSQYDGSTSINAIPRHPTSCAPEMPGG